MTIEIKHNRALVTVSKGTYEVCADCGGNIESDSEWLGEDKNGRGHYRLHEWCEDCGNFLSTRQAE